MHPSKKTAAHVCRKLAEYHGYPPVTHPQGRPLDVLVETILSQHTSDKNSHRAYLELRRHFPKWHDVIAASPQAVEKSIRSGGLARQKSVRIQQVLSTILEREGRLTLNRLRRLSDSEAYDYLVGLPGVGGKTACCVLLFALNRPVMPVDTHIVRITRRMGWISPRGTQDQARAAWERALPPDGLYHAHVLLIAHGRRICSARKPNCGQCPIHKYCATGRKTRQNSASML